MSEYILQKIYKTQKSTKEKKNYDLESHPLNNMVLSILISLCHSIQKFSVILFRVITYTSIPTVY